MEGGSRSSLAPSSWLIFITFSWSWLLQWSWCWSQWPLTRWVVLQHKIWKWGNWGLPCIKSVYTKQRQSGQKWFLRWVLLGFGGWFVLKLLMFMTRWRNLNKTKNDQDIMKRIINNTNDTCLKSLCRPSQIHDMRRFSSNIFYLTPYGWILLEASRVTRHKLPSPKYLLGQIYP